jgi:exopolyphosphatase/guanosine-5'-triphosphate,3'-diphosphate pyrophosphatase
MHPGRVDVIGGGALILAELVDLVRQRQPAIDEITVSEHDILDGLALSLA